MPRRSQHDEDDTVTPVPVPDCALCGRPVPPDVPQSLHHLIPKLKGGKGGPTVLMM
jgi:hypothetical protein